MPRPKIDATYAERVSTLAEEGEKPPAIFRALEQQAQKEGRKDYPSERTVRRLYEAHRAQPEAIRKEASLFRWPQAMLNGSLPWEASRASLDLLRYYTEKCWGRPTIRSVRWLWRTTLAAPGLSPDATRRLAALIHTVEINHLAGVELEDQANAVELYLAYQPWRSAEDRAAVEDLLPRWIELIERGHDAIVERPKH
jgi:hypothetical protein